MSGVRKAPLSAALLLAFVQPVSAQWSPGWVVRCASLGSGHLSCPTVASNAVYGPGDARVDDLAHFLTTQLDQASAWMEGLGFAAPHVEMDAGRYKALITDRNSASANRNDRAYYLPTNGGSITLVAVMPYPTSPELSARLTDPTLSSTDRAGINSELWAVAHELFHGVQTATIGPSRHSAIGGADWEWIKEGTAEAAASIFGENAGYRAGGVTARSPKPDYTEPLDSSDNEAYAKWHFWRSVGREIGARDEISYLKRFFEASPGGNSISWANTALSPLVDGFLGDYKGLYGLYPQVIANHANDKSFYESPGNPVGSTDLSLPGTVNTFNANGQVDGLTSYAAEILVTVPPDRIGGLTIELDEATRQNPSLHLIVNDERLDELPGSRRNVFMTALSDVQQDTFLVRVVNVAPQPDQKASERFALHVVLEALDKCESAQMMNAVDPAARAAAIGGGLAQPLMAASAYEAQREDIAGLHPAPGRFSVTGGGISDGGLGCTDPLGTNPMLTEDGDALRARMMQNFQNMSPADLRAVMTGSAKDSTRGLPEQVIPGVDPGRMQAAGAMMSEMMGPGGDALIQIYSPAAPSWQLGQAGLIGSWNLYRHSGLGGWDKNAAASVTVRVLSNAPDSLREGETYPAELLLPQGADLIPVYSRWAGTMRTTVRGGQAHQGVVEELSAGRLSGSVTITGITGAEVRGTFDLSGDGLLRYAEREWTYRDGELVGDQCVGPDGDQCYDVQSSVSIKGTFAAPAAVAVKRPGRAIAFTHKLGSRP